MLGIGLGELAVIAMIGLALIAVPVALVLVLVVVLRKKGEKDAKRPIHRT